MSASTETSPASASIASNASASSNTNTNTSPMTMRVTIHLTAADRELLAGIRQRSEAARAQWELAERDFVVAGTGMATSRGLRAVEVVGLSDTGLVVSHAVEAAPSVPSAPPSAAPEPS